MKTNNELPKKQSILKRTAAILSVFILTLFLSYSASSGPSGLYKSSPYATINATSDAELAMIPGAIKALDSILAKLKTKAEAKKVSGGDEAFNGFISNYLTAVDSIDNSLKSDTDYTSTYEPIFKYIYPRALAMMISKPSIFDLLSKAMGGDEEGTGTTTPTTSTIPSVTPTTSTTTTTTPSTPVSTTYPGCDKKDIKLVNGQIWAACNVGAETTTDVGNIYQWGRTDTRWNSDWSATSWGAGNKGPCEDGYHVPTMSDFEVAFENIGDKLPTLPVAKLISAQGKLETATSGGGYWSSGTGLTAAIRTGYTAGFNFIKADGTKGVQNKLSSLSVRCINNNSPTIKPASQVAAENANAELMKAYAKLDTAKTKVCTDTRDNGGPCIAYFNNAFRNPNTGLSSSCYVGKGKEAYQTCVDRLIASITSNYNALVAREAYNATPEGQAALAAAAEKEKTDATLTLTSPIFSQAGIEVKVGDTVQLSYNIGTDYVKCNIYYNAPSMNNPNVSIGLSTGGSTFDVSTNNNQRSGTVSFRARENMTIKMYCYKEAAGTNPKTSNILQITAK